MNARRAWLLALGASIAALAYDTQAAAAEPKRALLLVASAAALALAIAGLAKTRRPGLRVALPAALFVGCAAFSALSLAWGEPSGTGLLAAWAGAAALALAVSCAGEDEARRVARAAGALIALGSSVAATAQALLGARGVAIHGGHGNANWLGLVLAVSLPLAVEQAITLGRRSGRLALFVTGTLGLGLSALYLSHSRVAFVAVLVASAAWGLVATRSRRFRLGIALVAAVALAGGAQWVAAERVPEIAASVADGERDADVPAIDALDGRIWIWRASVAAARDALPLGRGLGGFHRGYLEAQGGMLAALPPGEASRTFVNATTAHADWIEALATGGLLAFALLFAALALGARAAWQGGWHAGVASLVALGVAMTGDSPLHQPAVLIVLALVLAALPRRLTIARRGAVLATLGAALAASAWLLAPATSAWIATRALSRAREAEPAARLALVASAARIDRASARAAVELGLLRLELGDAAGALADLERSRALTTDLGVLVAIGNARMALGDPDRASRAYEAALALHPGSFRAHAALSLALAARGLFTEADAHVAVARSLFPGSPKLAAIAEAVRRAKIDEAAGAPP